MLTKEELNWAQRYWTSANYLAAAAIYLKDNFLLDRKVRADDVKDALLGHWGTCPGINFIYTHLNLMALKHQQPFLLVNGPGHGFAAILAQEFLEGSLGKYYPELTQDSKGMGNLIKSFCWPSGFPSHINPAVPGAIHEGGELGYALATAFGAAFDNPNLIVAAIIGDGECETGPTATAWHSNKFLNPSTDGAVLPIIHLNGYKISSPTIYSTMDEKELLELFMGYGYDPKIVKGNHEDMNKMLEWAYFQIRNIQTKAREGKLKENPKWPLIIFKSPKGWTGVKKIGKEEIEGNWRSHQVPLKDAKTNPKSLRLLDKWLRSYKPEKLFPRGNIPKELSEFVPPESLKIGLCVHANGGKVMRPLSLPNPEEFSIKLKERGALMIGSMPSLGPYLKRVIELNQITRNFRIVSPDELSSNKLDEVLEVTGRRYNWKVSPEIKKDCKLSEEGRVMEMLSEHTLQGWLQGYTLTGRHGIFPSYEAFLPIVDSMVSQYLKFIEASSQVSWRAPVPALNYLVTSVCWRQDHNGFSHQNPGFITTLLNKAREEYHVRLYFPADSNMLLTTINHAFKSTNRVNVIVSDKQPIKQWLSYEEAVKQAEVGAGIWEFASETNPDVVLASCGDYQTQEVLASVQLLKKIIPEMKIRVVNVSELNVLGAKGSYPNALDSGTFRELFTDDRDVIFSFHGYPGAVKQLLFDRPNTHRFHVLGYVEKGTTTTPFDMLMRNGVSRYNIALQALEHAGKFNPRVAEKVALLSAQLNEKIAEHKAYIVKHGKDPEEINNWVWCSPLEVKAVKKKGKR